jgi:hypothetical protein
MRDKQGNVVNHQTGTLNSYVLDELTPGATYTFEVEAANQSGASGFSHVSRTLGSVEKLRHALSPLLE